MQILNVVDTDIRALVHSATGATLPDERSPAFLTFLDELERCHPALYAQVMAIFARPAERGTAAPLGRPAASLWRRPVLAGAPVLDRRRIGVALLLCGLAGSLPFVLSRTGPAPAVASTPSITEDRRQPPGIAARPNPRPVRIKAPLPSLVVTSGVAGGAMRPPVLTRTLPTPPRPVLVEAVVKPSPAPVRQTPLVKPSAAPVASAAPTTQPSPPLRSTQIAPAPTVLSPAPPKLPKPDPVAAPVAATRLVVAAPRPVVADKSPNVTPVRRTPRQTTVSREAPGQESVSRVVVTSRIATPAPRITKAPVPATVARARPPVPATASVTKAAAPVAKVTTIPAATPTGTVNKGLTLDPRLSPDAPSGDLNLPVNTTDSSGLQVATGGELNVVLDPPAPNAP